MIIRKENTNESLAIYDLVQTAFQTAKVSNGDEQNFVNRLRQGGNYIPELALVAEDNGELIGHIMLTRTSVEIEGGAMDVLLLAPLSVALAWRGKGIGGKLIETACALAKEMGYRAVFLVGDPDFYQRFGFKPAESFGVTNTNGIPSPYVMARELSHNALYGVNGSITFET